MKKASEKGTYLERADYSWSEDSIRFINTPSQTARNVYFYVQEVGLFRTRAPYFTERENLDSYLIFYTLSGKGILKYMGQTYTFLPGTVVYINCMEHHYYECLSGQEWEFLWLHFNGSSALGYYQEYIKNGFRVMSDIDGNFMELTMRRILALTQKKDLHSEIIVSSLIVQILTQILIDNSSENLGLGIMPDYIRRALQEINHRFTEPISLDELSRACGVSKYYLSHEFRRYIGNTLIEYVILCRVNHAKELLKYSDTDIEGISFQCGFRSASHFIRQFKAHVNMTPLQYRKKWGNSQQ